MIGFRRVDFLGHVVENGTITMETDKLGKIQDVEPPTTKKQVRAFIGLAGYYRKFIQNFAEIAVPLPISQRRLSQRKLPGDWNTSTHSMLYGIC